MVTILKAK